MVDGPVKWRLRSMSRSKGTYFVLETGRNETRRSLSLGFIGEDDAQTALLAMQQEEELTAGTSMYGRIFRLHGEDAAMAIRVLLERDVSHFGPEAADHGALRLSEYYATVYAPWRSEKKPRTWVTEEGRWRRILPVIGQKRVRDVDAHVVADYIDALRVVRDGKDLAASGSTRRLHRDAVQALLNYAHRQKHISEHVDLAVFRIEGATKTVLERADPLTLDELQRLMDASTPKHRVMWAVGAGEGLRPSELRRMRWEDVRFETRTLVVRGTKTDEASAEIPLTPLAFRELQAWWMRQGQPVEGAVFTAKVRGKETGEGYTSRSAYRTALENAAKKAGIGRGVNMYLLRHSFATIAWSLGIEQDMARRIMRHTDEKMLRDVYCRPRPADLVAKVAAFDLPGAGEG